MTIYLTEQDAIVSASNPGGSGKNVYLAGVGISGSSGTSGHLPITGTVEAEFDLPLLVEQYSPTTAFVRTVSASSTSSVLLTGSQLSRLGLMVLNEGPGVLFLQFGAPANTSVYSMRVPSQSLAEIPFSWAGPLSGFWSPATGTAQVTELL